MKTINSLTGIDVDLGTSASIASIAELGASQCLE